MSLAWYLQMIGRGLRPKTGGGNCLILDLAGNAETHGLPQNNRQWSLKPRGHHPDGGAPVVWCEKCHGVSPAASHSCVHCAAPFGKDCPRCGDWRDWKRWSHETRCGHHHELVCNLCHLDAHIQAHLPVTDELRRLNDMEPELEIVLRNLLEDERQRASGADNARKSKLRYHIAKRESELASDDLIQVFNDHITEVSRKEALVDKTFAENVSPVQSDFNEWTSFVKFSEWDNIVSVGGGPLKPIRFRDLHGNETPVRSWIDLIRQTAEWLIQQGIIVNDDRPTTVENSSRYLINARPYNASRGPFKSPKKLSNGLYLESQLTVRTIARWCGQLLTKFGQYPAQFHAQLR